MQTGHEQNSKQTRGNEMKDTLTIDDILKMKNELMKYAPNQQDNPLAYKPMHFNGMRLYEAHDSVKPKIQVSEWFADKWLTNEAKERINSKLVEMLGVRVINPIPEGVMYRFNNSIIVRTEDIARILHVSA